MNKSEKKVDPLVTVVIAVFNGASTLQSCFDSIAGQNYPNIEMIVMDGGSSDSTVNIIRANEDEITYWESKPDRGIYHAWNKALLLANGDYICFLGADDQYAEASSLAQMINVIDGDIKPDIISSRVSLINDSGQELAVKGDAWDWGEMKKWACVAHPGMLHHKTLFDRVGNFDERYNIAADYDLLLRLGGGVKSKYLNKVSVLMGASGVSNKNVLRVLIQTQKIQSCHPEIGKYKSIFLFIVAVIKVPVRWLLWKG